MNLSERDYIRQKNKHLPKIAEWVKANAAGDPIIPLSVSFEERLAALGSDEAANEECKTLGTKSALPKIITTMRTALELSSFFTTGTDEVRQWTIRKNTKAPQAAGVIHGDFEKTFIQVLVYNYDVLYVLGNCRLSLCYTNSFAARRPVTRLRSSPLAKSSPRAKTTKFKTAISF